MLHFHELDHVQVQRALLVGLLDGQDSIHTDLGQHIRNLEEKRKLQGGDSESGTFFSSLFNSLYLDDTNNNSYYSDNFFHTTLPANNTSSFTDVSSTWDMKSNYFSYPDAQPVKRSFVF